MRRVVSVGAVIPTYERVLETVRAVESVLAQTVQLAQVVVVDDGSSDEAVNRLSDALSDTPVELIRAPRSAHPGRTRNAALDHLSTDWVALLDSDDTWAPEKIERQLDVAGDFVAVCTNAHRIVDGVAKETVLSSLPRTVTLTDLIAENKIVNSSVLVRRDVLEDVGRIASSYLVRGCEDYATWLRVATRHDWLGLDEPLVDYVDEPTVSIRGSEEFSIHPGQQAAWLDYVIWRRQTGMPLGISERLLSGLFRRLLTAETRRRGRRTRPMDRRRFPRP